MKLQTVIQALNRIAPPQYACAWDTQIGLQIGDKNAEIKKILVALDITSALVALAAKQRADLIVAHHALFFRPLESIDLHSPLGKNIAKLIKNDIAVFIAHTNLDAAPDGVNWTLARQYGLTPETCEVLEPTYREQFYKYVVFVPAEAVEAVHGAIAVAGGGHIGKYSDCTFRGAGTGTFRPLAGTRPHIGRQGRLEKTPELRVETIIPVEKISDLLNAVRAKHPYEEIAYDLYPLKNSGRVYGLGLLGQPAPNSKYARYKKIAVASGSGGSLVQRAWDKGAKLLITGEAGYHDQLLAAELGLELKICGHRETEEIVVPILRQKLRAEFPALTVV
ncbi:Nif3-like dinuclear metal center hexameric protein [Candidatus Termititenax persephonae]|uniref:GTP cyclohydrolase 1 type 2 homolog n=1 Tax=Candidatus Termititenax persephonae TaxID=2218525 RepID=A0A388TGD2_9BACT|nr:Nif3-like dinuclear metal center hexameric protein [Candidatus Termititenax persephonae]